MVTLNGTDHYLGRFGTTASSAEYDRVIAEWTAHGRQLPRPDQGLSVNELMLAYLRFAEGYYRDPDKELDKIKLSLRPLKKPYGLTPAGNFGPLALKAVREAMIEAGLARRTINIRIGVVKRMFKWAVENELRLQLPRRLPALRGTYHFPRTTSCSICLSSVSSATAPRPA